jgi:sugar diacid utilization regulator
MSNASTSRRPPTEGTAVPAAAELDAAQALREQLSALHGLLALSTLMTESDDERQIINIVRSAVESFAPCHLRGIWTDDVGWLLADPSWLDSEARLRLQESFEVMKQLGGPVDIPGAVWAWALPLRSLTDSGYVVVAGEGALSAHQQFLLRSLAQQCGIALGRARLHCQERAAVARLAQVNAELERSVGALQRNAEIHRRLTEAAAWAQGQQGIANAVHEATGYPVGVEDRHGNLVAHAGPWRDDAYAKDAAPVRARLLARLAAERRPLRQDDRVLALAQPRADVLGVLVLLDPDCTSGDHEVVALEHGATVLSMELARLRSVAEAELRHHRDLLEALLAGHDDDRVATLAQGLGYDLNRPQRVVVVEGRTGGKRDDDVYFHAVRRAVARLEVGTLLAMRNGSVVVIAVRDFAWEEVRQAIVAELGTGGRCRLGVGGGCEGRATQFADSYRQAQLSLRMLASGAHRDGVACFDDFGVYRLLSGVDDLGEVERFVLEWLGALIDYDKRRNGDLVRTLSAYLEAGGNYEGAAAALIIHRSTLRYRLQRIRDISGHDLADPGTRFNLQLSTRAWTTMAAMRA